MTDIYEKTIEDLGGLMIKFFGCNRITMPIQQAIVLLEAHKQIVLCKDCKHRGNSEKCVISAISEEKDFPLFMLDNRGEWFCADGELKD